MLAAVCTLFLTASGGVLEALIVTILFWVAAYGYGALTTGWLHLEDARSSWESAPLVGAVGLAVLVLLVTLLGVAGALNRAAITALLLLGVALAAPYAHRSPAPRRPAKLAPEGTPAAVWWWGLVGLMLIGLVGAVAPEVRHDALGMHLPIAREFAAQQAIVEMRQQIQSYFPLNAQVLYSAGMLLVPGGAVPKLMHYAAGVHVSLLAYSLGARISTPWVGLASAAIFASTPLVYWTGGTAYTDLWSVLFSTAALAGLACFASRPSHKRAFTTGLLAGTAVGFKLVSMVVALPVAAALLLIGGRSFPRWRARLSMFGAFALGGFLAGSFWYGRAWVLTGNPVFPMLNAVFKSPYWPVENTRLNMHLFGMGTSVWDLVRLPWNLSLHANRFVEDGNIGLVYLALLPFAMWAILRRLVAPWAWGVLLAGGLLWFFNAQYLRYLLPLFPLAAIVGSAGLLGKATPGGTALRAGLVLVVALTATAATWVTSGAPGFPFAVARGSIARDDYTAAYVAGFRVADHARRSLPQSARIYGAGEDMAFYYERFFVPISWLGRLFDPSLPDAVLGARTGYEIQTILRQAGFSHLVVNRDYPVIARWRRPDGWLAREALWEDGPRLEHAYGEHYLFRLSAQRGTEVRRGRELLQNPEMFPGPTGGPAGWDRHGALSLSRAVGGPGGAPARVRLGGGAYLMQRVVVSPETLHALEAGIRSGDSSATARLFIQWLDESGRVIDHSTWRPIRLGPEMKRYAIACTAPRTARSAQVWLIADDGSEAEFTGASFYTLR